VRCTLGVNFNDYDYSTSKTMVYSYFLLSELTQVVEIKALVL